MDLDLMDTNKITDVTARYFVYIIRLVIGSIGFRSGQLLPSTAERGVAEICPSAKVSKASIGVSLLIS